MAYAAAQSGLAGLQGAFLADDPERLHDALFQSAATEHAKNIPSSGMDHCSNFRIALNALAAGLFE
ncbi:MAG: hypothetical protein LBU11_07800 [Zoogloeaceae bacterium]|jgi:hypothetical protein|nr:hypothetical protein [Zoogloeaceae bacterium]